MSQYSPSAPGPYRYPPNTGGYPATSPGYPPNTGGYPATSPGYPLNTGGYPPTGGYPATLPSYPPKTGGYPHTSPGYPPSTGPYPPGQPNAQIPMSGFPAPQKAYPPTEKLQLDDGQPCAPPLSQITDLPEYVGLTFDSAALKPPSYESVSAPTVHLPKFQNTPSLTEEEAREALLEFVSENCCYGSKAAKQMRIRDITFNSAIHYKLESYGEQREAAWAFEPYEGQQTPVHVGGYAPAPWEISILNDKDNFVNSKQIVEVPNTTNIRPCHKCLAMGRVRCKDCFGMGRKQCTWCHGSGTRTHFDKTERCTSCHGGYDSCTCCHGTGQTECETCKGHCQLRYFIRMTVTWKNHVDDHISGTGELPDELIRSVSGQKAFEDKQPRVWPISNFPDPGVNSASRRLVEQHKTSFPKERILMQRQQVQIVPIGIVDYTWKNTGGKFFVYGFEKKVHFPDYPQSCCCGCQII